MSNFIKCNILQRIVENFLREAGIIFLLISLSSDGFLIPSMEFTGDIKTKKVYFIKSRRCCLTDDNKSRVLIVGDCNANVLIHLKLLTNEVKFISFGPVLRLLQMRHHLTTISQVFSAILLNLRNQTDWSLTVVDDIERGVHNLKEHLSRVQSFMKGETLLVIPDHIERICKVENFVVG